jgi:hypothetical protein
MVAKGDSRIVVWTAVAAIAVCVFLLAFVKVKERFSLAKQGWSNGNVTSESVKLEANVHALNPAIWMDGETFYGADWLDKSGKGNNSSGTRAVAVGVQTSAAYGCNAAFKYVSGRRAKRSGLALTKGWPTNNRYTFFHVTRYDGSQRGRIWTNAKDSRGVNWLSGHHGTVEGRYHHNRWIDKGRGDVVQARWVLSADQHDNVRCLVAGEPRRTAKMDGRAFKPLPHGAAIGEEAAYTSEASDWACAEVLLFDSILSAADVRKVERYLEIKYGFV